MEARFIEIAKTSLSDNDFFDDVFTNYIKQKYKDSDKCREDLSDIRKRFKQNDPHIQEYLRDKIESVMTRYNLIEYETVNADKIRMKRKIEELEEKIEHLEEKIDALT